MDWDEALIEELNKLIALKDKRIHTLQYIIKMKDEHIAKLDKYIDKIENPSSFTDGLDEGCGHDEVAQDLDSEYHQMIDKDF